MKDNFIRHRIPSTIAIKSIITIFYMELPKDFRYEGERHNFWEMVYIDKGQMLCTAEESQFILKNGEVAFHKPNEFHNLSGNQHTPPNVSILTFECDSPAMQYFENKIFRLNAEEKALLSMLFEEGMSCFRLADPQNPLLQKLETLPDAPFGSMQMTKSLLELLLIKLHRHKDLLTQQHRLNIQLDGMDVPIAVKEILDVLHSRLYDTLTVADVAKAVGKSEATVKKLFSLYRAGGMMRYYSALKVKEAKKLIREGRYNFAQIAELLHYDTPQYFSKCFKSVTHMTPSDYRRSILR